MAGSSFDQSNIPIHDQPHAPPSTTGSCEPFASGSWTPQTYQFCKTSLSLLVDRLHPLIHGLLLLFQHLGVFALLQTLEDLSGTGYS